MNKTLLSLALAASVSAPALAADTWTVDKVHSDVTFTIRHFVSRVHGRFTDFSGTVVTDTANPAASSVEFTIQTASIDTGVAQRDQDLRSPKFFDVAKYPTITFKSTKVVSKGNNGYEVTGTLTMHGVSKTVTLPVSYLGRTKDVWGGERAGFELTTSLDRKDYGINWNQTLDSGGVMLGDDVGITIDLETVLQKAPAAAK